MSDSPDIVYRATLDGHFAVQVLWDSPYVGILTVTDTRLASGEPLLIQKVTLAYNAQFGPDAADVADWQAMAITAVDDRKDKSGKTS